MKLKDTVDLMCSEDYQERMLAEYQQLYLRMVGLRKMLNNYAQNKLNFKPNCSLELLQSQYNAMADYIEILFTRLLIEGIPLDLIEKVKE